jgi:all-trans-retinol dehydrogenase (NAD+)
MLEPFVEALDAAGTPVLEPQAVADAIAEHIFKCKGGQVFLPSHGKLLSALRGCPNWLQETVRGAIIKPVLQVC